MIGRRSLLVGAAAGGLVACAGPGGRVRAQEVVRGRTQAFRPVVVTRGLEHPWAVAFLPDGDAVVTERPGQVRRLRAGRLDPRPLDGAPEVFAVRQGGLLDLVPHPAFATNRLLFMTYARPTDGGAVTRVARAQLDGDRLVDLAPLIDAEPEARGGFHFGSRLAFLPDGTLLATVGERYDRDRAQRPDDLAGKVLRLATDGRPPADNPFVGRRGGPRPEIFTLGHRNPQGLAIHPETGSAWLHEHGPRGGDEVNVLVAGANYGWPLTTHGVDYSGATISPDRALPGVTDPIHVWTPSIAPSGMAFVGPAYPGWRGDLMVGALAGQKLVRLRFQGDRLIDEEDLLEGEVGRIRDVRAAPDGRLHLLTDERDGALIRLDPV
jgi:glucose/arabinose dehydrogenase